jgi:hypothetical protein
VGRQFLVVETHDGQSLRKGDPQPLGLEERTESDDVARTEDRVRVRRLRHGQPDGAAGQT